MKRLITTWFITFCAACVAWADTYEMPGFTFSNIDGGEFNTDDWRGRPILVVNTASMCAFTPQYEGLQQLHDKYADHGLVVLAVPSDDFNQEKDNAVEVKEFCTVNYDITLPMTDITHVKRGAVHPFYEWMNRTHNWTPRWNFSKVLIGPRGQVLGTWGSMVTPTSQKIISPIQASLAM